jgi:hypothetical protein
MKKSGSNREKREIFFVIFNSYTDNADAAAPLITLPIIIYGAEIMCSNRPPENMQLLLS